MTDTMYDDGDDFEAEDDAVFEKMFVDDDNEPEIDERREMRESLTSSTMSSSRYDYEGEKWENDWAIKSEE